VSVKDSTVQVQNDKGETIKEEHWHNIDHYHFESDSTAHYKALYDSIRTVKVEKEPVIQVVEKDLTKWQQRFLTIGKVSSGIYGGLLIATVVWIIYRIRRKKIVK